jgi:hypothetical protein
MRFIRDIREILDVSVERGHSFGFCRRFIFSKARKKWMLVGVINMRFHKAGCLWYLHKLQVPTMF